MADAWLDSTLLLKLNGNLLFFSPANAESQPHTALSLQRSARLPKINVGNFSLTKRLIRLVESLLGWCNQFVLLICLSFLSGY